MFLESFKGAFIACLQIFILGFLGYLCFRRRIVDEEGLNLIGKLVIEVTLPFLILTQILENFSFSMYERWWLLPLISIVITGCGFLVSLPFSLLFKGAEERRQFMTLIGFQNSGYLMLTFVATYLPENEKNEMFILIFLFLIGFNLLMWSIGVSFLTQQRLRQFEFGSLFSPPIVASLLGLLAVFAGLNKFLPRVLIGPLKMVGNCTLPLALFVVGGNLAQVSLRRINFKLVSLVILGKLIILPLIALGFLIKFNLSYLLSLLILLEAAMPPAVSPSVILKHYKKRDIFISQGIFFGHLCSILTIPFFLSLYFLLNMVK